MLFPIPTLPVKNYRLYSPSAMTNALKAVKEDKLTTSKTAVQFGIPQATLRQRVLQRVQFGIPQTTLRQHVLQRVHPKTISPGPPPPLSQQEEVTLVDHLKCMASVGYGYTRSEVINIASCYAGSVSKLDKDRPVSSKRFRNFIRRLQELNVTKFYLFHWQEQKPPTKMLFLNILMSLTKYLNLWPACQTAIHLQCCWERTSNRVLLVQFSF